MARQRAAVRDQARFADVFAAIVENVEQVIQGKEDPIRLALVCLIAEGHLLIEDVPGVGKTSLAKAMAVSLGCEWRRIQFTPDLLPSDVTGVRGFNQKVSDFEFRPGPVFANVLLADEINRATPKTQSALLEAMEEKTVTVDGETHELPKPFLVMATQNPIEYSGTFPLPEAQLDRFFLRTALGYPGVDDELRILEEQRFQHPLETLRSVVGLEEVEELRVAAQYVYLDALLHRWIVELVRATREQGSVVIGSSVRGSLALERAARAWALLDGRSYVLPDDVERLFVPVLVHRVVFTTGFVARARATSWPEAIEEFRSECLELAPRPGSEDDPLFDRRQVG